MSDTQLFYIDTITVMETIRDYINNNLTDPFDDSGNTRESDVGIATIDDDTKIANYPKILISVSDLPRERISGGNTAYRERFRHELIISYVCHKEHTWSYNGKDYKGKQQCIKYLLYLGDTLKKAVDESEFEGLNELTFGSISNPVADSKTFSYKSILPIKLDTYGRVGD